MEIKRFSLSMLCAAGALMSLPSCTGILAGFYDELESATRTATDGTLSIDASSWTEWHYIDLPGLAASVAADSLYDTSAAWVTLPIPEKSGDESEVRHGVYTYRYDVFGAGTDVREFIGYSPSPAQPEPESWTIAVHRDNVRTNGCLAAATGFRSLEELPSDGSWAGTLEFVGDTWTETEVWCDQSRMLLGIVGSQGIEVNPVLSSWLKVEIPPMPPSFVMESGVYVLRLPDDTYAALQLVDYIGATGAKCCLTVKYRYPI